MASGFQTSDGNDLDNRYLGINAKAASAGYADSCGNANYANSAGTANNLSGGFSRIAFGSAINISARNTYTAPKNGIAVVKGSRGDNSSSLSIAVGGKVFYSGPSVQGTFAMNAGWQIVADDYRDTATINGAFYPFV